MEVEAVMACQCMCLTESYICHRSDHGDTVPALGQKSSKSQR